MNREMIAYLSDQFDFGNIEIIEKDMVLNKLLLGLSDHSDLRDKYIFKGGTCLIKTYFDYYRFSEDLDFTFSESNALDSLSSMSARKRISKEKDLLAGWLVDIASKEGLDFRFEKDNERYFQYGGGNRFMTFKVWFESTGVAPEQFVKLQVNYIEKILFPVRTRKLTLLKSDLPSRTFTIFPDLGNLREPVSLKVYSQEEIVCEKIRSILTRRGFKARDILDLYKLDESGYDPKELEEKIIQKVSFMLDLEKYKKNIKRDFRKMADLSELKDICLTPPPVDLEQYTNEILAYCEHLRDRLLE